MVDIGQATSRQSSRCIEIADRRSLAAQDYREVIRRSSPAIEERTRCDRRQCRVLTFALARVRRTLGVRAACCARRSFKETTMERYQNKNRYGVPRGRIRAPGETGIPIANRVAIGETKAKENAA